MSPEKSMAFALGLAVISACAVDEPVSDDEPVADDPGTTAATDDGDDGDATSTGSADDAAPDDEPAGSSEGPDAPEEPLSCAEKTCGSDLEAQEFCGEACPRGEGCDAFGVCGQWPPDLDQIYDGNGGFQLPPCDHGDDPGAGLENASEVAWIKTMRPLVTDCPAVVQQLHPLAMIGAEIPEDQRVYVFGSCAEYSDGQWGTAHDGVLVWGQTWSGEYEGFTFSISWRAVIDHNLDPPQGIGVAHIHDSQGIDLECEIEMEVTYERCPEHRDDCGNYPIPY
ncbi:MAG: hypothetical protein AAF721_06885 [Myxococcota bacterium]